MSRNGDKGGRFGMGLGECRGVRWEGAVNRRGRGGREYVFDSKRKKVNSVPLFFVGHLALTLPCLLYSLPQPPRPPQLIHTDIQGPADLQDITPASLFYLLHRDACFLIYILTVWCVYVHPVATGTEGGEREIGRESDRKGEREEERKVE